MARSFTELLHQCLPESARKAERDRAYREWRHYLRIADKALEKAAELDEKYVFGIKGGEGVRRG